MRKHPVSAWAFIAGLFALAWAATLTAPRESVTTQHWWIAVSLALILCFLHLLPVISARGQVRYEISAVFETAAILMLPFPVASLVIAAGWMPYLFFSGHPEPWLGPLFNWAQITVTGWGVRLVMRSVPADAGIYLAVPMFVLLNTALVVTLVALDKGLPWHKTEVVDFDAIISDLGLAALGAVLVKLGQAAPVWVGLALVPLFALYRVNQQFQLIQMGLLDPKTLVYNSRYFERTLSTQLAKSQRNGRPVTIVFGDLDYLRTINNTYGHLTGDAVITQIARIMQQHVRRDDVVARFGGEEFVIMLPGAHKEEAAALAERVRKAIAGHPFRSGDGKEFHVTMSFGVATCPEDGCEALNLIDRADTAAYRAKDLGRNRVVVA